MDMGSDFVTPTIHYWRQREKTNRLRPESGIEIKISLTAGTGIYDETLFIELAAERVSWCIFSRIVRRLSDSYHIISKLVWECL